MNSLSDTVSDDRESRYAHLLEPIRDLAGAWHIDLASELEEYLAELDQIRIAFEPSQLTPTQTQGGENAKTLNFAQAALLIQGSACIYSKKVEYLYALLYQTLDVLIDKRKSKQAPSSINAAGDDLDAMLFSANDGALLDLDDTMVDGRGIDLSEEEESDPINDYPAQNTRRQTLMIRAPLSLLSDNLYESAATADKTSSAAAQQSLSQQFKISGCKTHRSGALLVESNEATLLRDNDKLEIDPALVRANEATPSGAMPFGSPRAILEQQLQEEKTEQGIVALAFDDPDDGFQGGGGDFGDDEENELEHKYDVDDAPVQPKKSVRFAEELEEEETAAVSRGSRLKLDEEDLWSQLDPHDDSALVPRPYRKGQTIRKPYIPEVGSDAVMSADLKIHMLNSMHHTNPAQAILMRGIVKQSIHAPFFAEFSTLYLREQEKRKKRKRSAPVMKAPTSSSMRKVQPSSPGVAIPLQDQDDHDDQFGGGAMDEFGDENGGGGLDAEFDAAAFKLAGMDDGQEQDEWEAGCGATVKDFTAAGLEASLSAVEKSYEDLCKEHVEAYLRSAEQYLTSSLLSRRVLEWQERLLPILQEEERHGVYDIQQYGRTILRTMDEKKNDESMIDFEDACKGQPQYEICRMFLATLQLANNGNVDIAPSVLDSSGGSSMALRILSMDDRSMDGLTEVGTAPPVGQSDMVDVAPAANSASCAPTIKRKPTTKGAKRKQPPIVTEESDENALPPSENLPSSSIDADPSVIKHTNDAATKIPLAHLSSSDSNRRTRRAAGVH